MCMFMIVYAQMVCLADQQNTVDTLGGEFWHVGGLDSMTDADLIRMRQHSCLNVETPRSASAALCFGLARDRRRATPLPGSAAAAY